MKTITGRRGRRGGIMEKYDGFQIACHCRCSKCGTGLYLEGYSDAWGNHFCASCNDYVKPIGNSCEARTPKLVKNREKIIVESGALED